ncbi:MAG: ribosome silencing factor [Immundisolibacteraceae bacterium]|nr:ribosome silencing factor [Immundisolibacteraceae bacterium]
MNSAKKGIRSQKNMDAEAICSIAIDSLENYKAIDIVKLEIRKLTDIADYMLIVSGGSTRQVKALAKHLVEDAKKAGCPSLGVEGLEHGDWVLVDLVDVIVHVMIPEARELYRLEELWNGSPYRELAGPFEE